MQVNVIPYFLQETTFTYNQKNYLHTTSGIFVQVNVVPNFSFAGNHIHLQARSGLASSLRDGQFDPVHKHNSNLNASLHDCEIDGGDISKGELWIRLQPPLLRITEPKKPET